MRKPMYNNVGLTVILKEEDKDENIVELHNVKDNFMVLALNPNTDSRDDTGAIACIKGDNEFLEGVVSFVVAHYSHLVLTALLNMAGGPTVIKNSTTIKELIKLVDEESAVLQKTLCEREARVPIVDDVEEEEDASNSIKIQVDLKPKQVQGENIH